MHLWSKGQTRGWQGPHSTSSGGDSSGVVVSVQAMWVGPNRLTTGRSKAAAKWRGPLSVLTSRVGPAHARLGQPERHVAARPGYGRRALRARATICRARSRSPGRTAPEPRRPASSTSCLDEHGKGSAGQCLAAP